MLQEDNRSLSDRVARLFRRLSNRSTTEGRTVSVGQRFFRVSHTAPVWIVRKVFTPDGLRILHAVVERLDQPSDRSLIAIDRLLDEHNFRLDRRTSRSANTTGRTRRRRDDAKQLFFR
jgi:hypothetical protein